MLFEAFHDQMDKDTNLGWYRWAELIQDLYGLVDYYEIISVLSGTAAAEKEVDRWLDDEEDDGINFFDSVRGLKNSVWTFYEKSKDSKDEQLSTLMETLRLMYEQERVSLKFLEWYKNKDVETICFFAVLTDAPALVVKVMAEVYEIDFWELWEQIRDVAKRNRSLYGQEPLPKVEPISTMNLLRLPSDDMILFWEHDINIEFSQELKEWFASLKSQYEEILEEGIAIENPLGWIVDLMEYADENYYHVYTYTEFLEETMEHLNDSHFLALWKIYDNMLHDPEMEEAGNVVFVPDEPEYEKCGLHYLGKQPRRRLKMSWSIMDRKERDNIARLTFRRYMALLENRNLRKEVFGF